jgi:glycosyltransferase involved in cell wall biosynthesis
MTAPASDIFVSVVAPLYDDAAHVAAFIRETEAVLLGHYAEYEIILVDDGSRDDTRRIVESLLQQHRCLRLLRLSRRFGVEIAVAAGLETAIGDFVVTMQPAVDPPGMIPRFVDLARDGNDIVIGVVSTPPHPGPVYRALRSVYFALCRRLLDVEVIPGSTCFRAFSRQAVNALLRVRSRRRHFSLLVYDIGFDSIRVAYEQSPRGAVVRPSLPALVRGGVSLIVHNSTAPLRLVSLMGLIGSLLSVGYAVYVVLVNMLLATIAPGWTTLSLQVTGLMFLMFLMLTFIGEYLVRLLEEVSDRPLYHVYSEKTSPIMLANPERTNVIRAAVEAPAEQGRRARPGDPHA